MIDSIKFYDNQEEHGIIYDWGKIFKEYRRIIKKAGVKDEIYDPRTAPVLDNKYIVLMSERSTGKTTNWLLIGMIMHEMYGTVIQYVRQDEDMIKPSIVGEIFRVILSYNNACYIPLVTGGKYSGIYYKWKKCYFCNYDEKGKPVDLAPVHFLQFLSIDNSMDYKSGYNAPRGDLIIFDEFIGKTYNVNEFVYFEDLCSTIIRKRISPIIVMASNTINYNSTYFKELMVSKEVKKLKVGQSKSIITPKGTHVYIEIIGIKPTAIKSKVNRLFFGFDNPRLASITGGEQTWSFDPVPHIVNADTDDIIDRTIRLDCGDTMLQLDLTETEDRGLIVNVHECTTVHEDSIILTNGEIRDRQHIWGLGKGEYCKLLWKLYSDNKWYYDTNETGSMVADYVKTYRQLKK